MYWIATNNGLARFNPNTEEIVNFSKNLRFDVVTEDRQKNIWAGSSNGLFKINAKTLATEYFSSDKNSAQALSHPEINVIQEDKNHAMWIGTVGGAISR